MQAEAAASLLVDVTPTYILECESAATVADQNGATLFNDAVGDLLVRGCRISVSVNA